MQEAIAAPEILFLAVGTLADEDGRADLQVVLAVADFQKPERNVVMDVRSAELTKVAANALLATKISFMNELANLAERLGADIERVRIGIGTGPRIGFQFIWPGCGYGGSCFPKDVQALVRTAQQAGTVPELLQAVEAVNQFQKQRMHRLISQHFGGAAGLAGRRFAVWGLAFKPNTDDMREALSRELLEALWADGATVAAYDPKAAEEAVRLYPSRWFEKGGSGAGASREGAAAQASTLRRRLAGEPVKTRMTRAAVQVYCDAIGMRRAGWCQVAVQCGVVGFENRSLVLRAVPERAGSGRVAVAARFFGASRARA